MFYGVSYWLLCSISNGTIVKNPANGTVLMNNDPFSLQWRTKLGNCSRKSVSFVMMRIGPMSVIPTIAANGPVRKCSQTYLFCLKSSLLILSNLAGTAHILHRFPTSYQLWRFPRANGSQNDYKLYGYPSGKAYHRVAAFWPPLNWLDD
jgi:hypothetical protein